MKPIWVQEFYNAWGFYPMAGGTLGDGSSWDETNPVQSTLANTIDSYDRDIRIGVRGRMAQEHEWPSSQAATTQAGYHKFITLQNQATKPTIAGTQLAAIYTKTVGAGLQEAFWENEAGTEVQLTNRSNTIVPTNAYLQTVYTLVTTSSELPTTIPVDNTIPQIGEGSIVCTAQITCISSTNIIEADAMIFGAEKSDVGNGAVAAIFIGTTANALVCGCETFPTPGSFPVKPIPVPVGTFIAGTTGAITFSLRAGCDIGTFVLNGTNGGAVLGGVLNSFLRLRERKV